MTKTVELTLPWPPSVNKIWATTKKGNWYETKVSKDFKEFVIYYARSKKLTAFKPADRIFFKMLAFPPDNRRRDLDNLAKVVCDAMQDAKIYKDDCQIKRIFMEMMPKKEVGMVTVTLETMD